VTLMTLPEGCPDCGRPTITLWWEQTALFRHAGYGESRRTVTRRCVCGWSLVERIESHAPEHRRLP